MDGDRPTLTGELKCRVPVVIHLLEARDGGARLQVEWLGERQSPDWLAVGDEIAIGQVITFNVAEGA